LDQGQAGWAHRVVQRSHAFKSEVPRVIRPDLLLADHGLSVTELESVPGGIGLTAWLNQTYSKIPSNGNSEQASKVLGGGEWQCLKVSLASLGTPPKVHIVVSDEAATYRPEMTWVAGQIDASKFQVHDASFSGFSGR